MTTPRPRRCEICNDGLYGDEDIDILIKRICMPSLSPGTAGAKEAYGIVIIGNDACINIPPDALKRYGIEQNSLVLLTSTRKGESGFAIINSIKAQKTVFNKILKEISQMSGILNKNGRYYVITNIQNGKIFLNPEMMAAFNLKTGDKLLVIKSTTVAMSLSLVDTWKKKFKEYGLTEAITNIDHLEIY